MGASTSRRLGSSRRILVASVRMNKACNRGKANHGQHSRPAAALLLKSHKRRCEAHLLIGKAAFAVKVVLEEGNVGFGPGRVAVKLLVGRFLGRAGLYVFDDAFLSRERVALVVGVDGKVDRGEAGAAVLDGADGRLCLETALVRHGCLVTGKTGRTSSSRLSVLQVGGGQ